MADPVSPSKNSQTYLGAYASAKGGVGRASPIPVDGRREDSLFNPRLGGDLGFIFGGQWHRGSSRHASVEGRLGLGYTRASGANIGELGLSTQALGWMRGRNALALGPQLGGGMALVRPAEGGFPQGVASQGLAGFARGGLVLVGQPAGWKGFGLEGSLSYRLLLGPGAAQGIAPRFLDHSFFLGLGLRFTMSPEAWKQSPAKPAETPTQASVDPELEAQVEAFKEELTIYRTEVVDLRIFFIRNRDSLGEFKNTNNSREVLDHLARLDQMSDLFATKQETGQAILESLANLEARVQEALPKGHPARGLILTEIASLKTKTIPQIDFELKLYRASVAEISKFFVDVSLLALDEIRPAEAQAIKSAKDPVAKRAVIKELFDEKYAQYTDLKVQLEALAEDIRQAIPDPKDPKRQEYLKTIEDLVELIPLNEVAKRIHMIDVVLQ